MKHLSTRRLRRVWMSVVLCAWLTLPQSATGQSQDQKPAVAAAADLSAMRDLAMQDAQAGKIQQAIHDYQQVLARQPDWQEGWWNLGTLEYGADQFTDARSTFTRVAAFAPAMGVAWSMLGLTDFATRNYSDARAHLEKAESLGIEDEEIKRVTAYHLGMLLTREGKFEQAHDLLLASFGGDANSTQLRFVLGLTVLRVPLLPSEVDPSKESLVNAAGKVATASGAELTLFPDLLAAYPNTPYLHYAYGLSLDRAGMLREALAQLHAETVLSPGSSLCWSEISSLHNRLGDAKEAHAAATKATVLAADARLGDRIVQMYSTAGASSPANQQAEDGPELWNRAMREYTQGEFAKAIADLKTCVRDHPDSGTGWAVLGLSEFASKQYENALIHLDRGRALGFTGGAQAVRSATYTLGILLIHTGEFDRAAEVLAAALKADPQDESIQYALGLALLRRKEFPDPKTQNATLLRAAGKIAALLQDSRYDEAFPLFESLLQQYPSEPFMHYTYANALVALSEFDQAILQMRRELEVSPGSELPYIGLASIYLRKHMPADAIPFAQHAVMLSPQSADAHYLLGRAALEAGDDTTAVPELETASRLSPGSPEVHFNLAKAYARAKMTDAAAKERTIFARLNELSENEKRQGANRSYSGPRDANTMSHPATPAGTSSQP